MISQAPGPGAPGTASPEAVALTAPATRTTVTGFAAPATDQQTIRPDADLLVVTELGYGKRTALTEYPAKGRNNKGVATINQKSLVTIGKISAARVVDEKDEVTLISSSGILIRLKVQDINRTGRATRGVRLMDISGEDYVASVARITVADMLSSQQNNEPNPLLS